MKNLYVAILFATVFTSCKKEDDTTVTPVSPETKGLHLNLFFNVGPASLVANNINYFNAAGNNYGVTRLQFYLSGFEFTTMTDEKVSYADVYFVDAFATTAITIPDLPFNHYKSVKVYIGLDSMHNVTNALPSTVQNTNMAWPEPMGGGYHFLKLEGNYINSGSPTGFAMHVGNNNNLVTNTISAHFETTSSDNTINLNMDINEWFSGPYIYNFDLDGNYTMGDSTAMTILVSNAADVLKITQ